MTYSDKNIRTLTPSQWVNLPFFNFRRCVFLYLALTIVGPGKISGDFLLEI